MKKMKKIRLILMAMLLVFGLSSMALAVPFEPDLGMLYIKFDNREQISSTGTITSPSGIMETNWGVFKVSSIATGAAPPPENFSPLSPPVWTDADPGEITGIWGNLQLNAADPAPGLNSTGGSMYLYWDDVENADLTTAMPSMRDPLNVNDDFAFTNFTDGQLLAKIDFVPGALTADANTSVNGTVLPSAGGFVGIANSFGNVDVAAGGLWANLMDGNYFIDHLLAPAGLDIKFRNVYEGTSGGHPWDDLANDIFGADSTDPARAFGVPEPATMLLLGSGLLGLAGFGRKRKFFKKD